ncbi:MAG: NAD-dependent DNA ligase LigA, partial [Acidobacteria bacterium]|nr:NAD-dependent DNA ligase LigA [Acidobacteriota bacterium]
GLKFEGNKKDKGPLEGLVFVLTGTLSKMSRNEAKEILENLGAKVSNTVTKETDFLIVGSEPGSKFEKAKKLNIKMLDEFQFEELLSSKS